MSLIDALMLWWPITGDIRGQYSRQSSFHALDGQEAPRNPLN
jgi:hypothetical protein